MPELTKRFVSALLVSLCFLCGHPLLQAQSPHGSAGEALQPGPNVNAAAGIVEPGDPAALIKSDMLLQRQNETVVAGSSRNPDHLLAAANDYRFVEFPDDPAFGGGQTFIARLIAKLFQPAGGRSDADGSRRRQCRRLDGRVPIVRSRRHLDRQRAAGGPLDNSPASLAAQSAQAAQSLCPGQWPCRNHRSGADRGTGGRMHLAVLGFIRFDDGRVGSSRMYYASYTDRNNREGGSCFNSDFVRQIDRQRITSERTVPVPSSTSRRWRSTRTA